jgi:hypothetical protein
MNRIRPSATTTGLLQGLAACGICGRKLAGVLPGPEQATPGYYCTGSGALIEGRGTRHLQFGGLAIDAAVAGAFWPRWPGRVVPPAWPPSTN